MSAESRGQARRPISVCASSSVSGSSDTRRTTASSARAIEQRLQKWLRGHLLAAEATAASASRRVRRRQQLVEEHDAVGVGPLQIVDPDHEQWRAASRASSSLNASNARRLMRRGSTLSSSAAVRRAATASTCSSTGNTRVSADTSRGNRPSTSLGRHRARDSGSGRRRPRRAPCTAPTRSRSSGRRARRRRRSPHCAEKLPHQRALADAGRTVDRHGPCAAARRTCVDARRSARAADVAADERRVWTSPSPLAGVDGVGVARQRRDARRHRSGAAPDRDSAGPCRWR